MQNAWKTLSIITATLVMAGGCAGEFDPPSLVNSLRPLAIRADPPKIDPAVATKLDALVVGQTEGATLCHAWGLCGLAVQGDGRFGCADPALLVELGTAPTATIAPSDLATLLAGAKSLAPPDSAAPQSEGGGAKLPALTVLFAVAEQEAMGGVCPGGIEAFLSPGCTDRERCVLGRKSLEVTAEARENPEITALQTDQAGDGTGLAPTWNSTTETALMSWFSTAGEFDKQRSFEDAPNNRLALPPGQGATVWLVLRDGGGGVAWASAEL